MNKKEQIADTAFRIEHLKAIITELKEDIEVFGPAGDDIERLNARKKELSDLEYLHQLLCTE